MIPHTYPSTYATPNGQQQMVVMFLSDVAGKQKWLDYIPVKLQGTVPNTYDNNGFIPVVATTATGETVPFKDYVPVFVDSSATDAWQVNNVGYIPYNYLSFSSAALNLDLLSGSLDSRVTFTRASGATRFNASGVLETVATNVPRFDHDPVTLAPRGLLIEGARTNLVVQSNNFADAIWAKQTGVTITPASGISPDGTNNASLVSGLLAAVGDRLFQIVTQATPVTAAGSMWFRGTESSIGKRVVLEVRRNTGTATAGTAEVLLTNQWQRVTPTITMLPDNQGLRLIIRSIDAEDVLIFGAQLEVGAFASSYIPTTSSQVTRAADVAVMTGTNFSSWYNQTEGTVFADWSLPYVVPSGVVPRVFSLQGNASANNNMRLRDGPGTSAFQSNDAVLNIAINTAFNPSQTRLGAAAYKTDDCALFLNNGSSGFDTTATGIITDPPTIMAIGANSAGGEALFGHIRRIAYWNTRLTNAELQSLTS